MINEIKDQLLLTEQDRVALTLGFADADALMLEVAKAARAVDYLMDSTWHRIDSSGGQSWFNRRKSQRIDQGLVIQDSEVTIEAGYDISNDSAIGLRAASTAAQRGLPISIDACILLSEKFKALPNPWPKPVLNDLVSLIGAGKSMIVGCSGGVFSIAGSQSSILTPGKIASNTISTSGAHNIPAIQANGGIYYIVDSKVVDTNSRYILSSALYGSVMKCRNCEFYFTSSTDTIAAAPP
jgi:hypothetical protein